MYRTGSVVLSKHVTYYDPRSGFSYLNMTPPPLPDWKGSISFSRRHVEQLGGFEPWESSHIPRNIEDEYYSFFKYIGEKIENICWKSQSYIKLSLNVLNILHILLLSSKSPCVLKIVVNFIIKCLLIILIGHILMKYKSSIIPPKNLCFSFYFLSLNFLPVSFL